MQAAHTLNKLSAEYMMKEKMAKAKEDRRIRAEIVRCAKGITSGDMSASVSAPRFAELVRETLERALAIVLAREREPPGPNPFDPPPGEAAGYRDWRVFVRQWEGSGLAVEEHLPEKKRNSGGATYRSGRRQARPSQPYTSHRSFGDVSTARHSRFQPGRFLLPPLRKRAISH